MLYRVCYYLRKQVMTTAYIYQYDKRHDVTYVYEKVQKTDPITGKSMWGRKIVGRLDSKTQAVVPTGNRGRKPTKMSIDKPCQSSPAIDYAEQYKKTNIELKRTQALLDECNQKLTAQEDQIAQLRALLTQALRLLDKGFGS